MKLGLMYDLEIFKISQETLENCPGLRQLFSVLPAGVEISISLENRLHTTLVFSQEEDRARLEPRAATKADIGVVMFSESIRILRENPPEDLTGLIRVLTNLNVSGHLEFRILSSAKDLYSKGYLGALTHLAPELQPDFTKIAMNVLGQAVQLAQSLKNKLTK